MEMDLLIRAGGRSGAREPKAGSGELGAGSDRLKLNLNPSRLRLDHATASGVLSPLQRLWEGAAISRFAQPGLGLRPRPEPRVPLAKHAKSAKKGKNKSRFTLGDLRVSARDITPFRDRICITSSERSGNAFQ